MPNSKSIRPRETILIVDDEEENLRVVCGVLSLLQYDFAVAFSAQEAWDRLTVRVPDLILLDVGLPDRSGIDLCGELQRDPRFEAIPVIFLSAANDKDLIVRALECGGVDYITKPFNKAELLSRVRTHLALKSARDALAGMVEDRAALVGILAHDFKSHLAGTLMSANLLKERSGDMPSRSLELVEGIAESTERMHQMITEFLSNQRAMEACGAPEPTVLAPILNRVLGDWERRAAEKRIVLQAEFAEDLPDVLAVPDALRQILDNLLSNAVKFSLPGAEIQFLAQRVPGGGCRIAVRDAGPGFTEEDLEFLFQRYRRLSAKPTAGEPSSGLGLSIAKALADAMRAQLKLETKPGDGSTFILVLQGVLPP